MIYKCKLNFLTKLLIYQYLYSAKKRRVINCTHKTALFCLSFDFKNAWSNSGWSALKWNKWPEHKQLVNLQEGMMMANSKNLLRSPGGDGGGWLGDFHILGSGIPEGEIRWAVEAACGGDVLASEEVSSGSLVQSVGCVDAVPAQVVEGIRARRHTDSGNSIGDIPSTEVVLVEVVFATLSTACRQWLCHICSFQYREQLIRIQYCS